MSVQQRGNFLTASPPSFSTTSTGGIFTVNDAATLRAATQWPRGPLAPTNLAAAAGNAQLSLSWTAPTTTHGTITNYLVEYTPSGGSAAYVLTGSTSASYTLTGLTNGTSYTVRVAAVNFTTGDWSGTATGTPINVIQLTATNFEANNFGDQNVKLGTAAKEVAATDWRITATTNWGDAYSNVAPWATAFDNVTRNIYSYFRKNGSAGGTFVELYHNPSNPSSPINLFLWVTRSPGTHGNFTSSWTVQGYVAGAVKYEAIFNWNFYVAPGD
jgi:hypothetical protein